jgi:AMP-binding enzyme
MLQRVPTAFDERIYGPDWRAWVDPEVPDEIAPTALLLDRHLGTPVEHKTALIVGGEAITYGALAQLVATVSTGLVARGVVPEDRILLFGTDSLDYVAMWLGAVRAGAVPAVVSDLYKARELLYFLRDTAARLLFIDAEQLGKLEEIADALPSSLQMVIVRGEPPSPGPRASRAPYWLERKNAGETPAVPAREVAPAKQRSPWVSQSAVRGNRPRGRTISTARNAKCPARICHSGLMLAPTVWATPMITPPASVPHRLPSPPMITASNA